MIFSLDFMFFLIMYIFFEVFIIKLSLTFSLSYLEKFCILSND